MNESEIHAAKGQTTKKTRRDQKCRRGVLDLPKAIEDRLAEGRGMDHRDYAAFTAAEEEQGIEVGRGV